MWQRTRRPFLPNDVLQHPVQCFVEHLAREHEQHLDLARGPDQSHVDDAHGLRDEGQQGRDVRDGVIGILRRGRSKRLAGRLL